MWREARERLDGLPNGSGLNIAYEAVDRHCGAGHGSRPAIVAIDRTGERRTISYEALRADSARFASALGVIGVGAGDAVFMLMPRRPEFHVAVLGALKARSVVCPLFPAFGPEPVLQRMRLGDARVLVTTPSLYERRIRGIRADLPRLDHVLVVGLEDGMSAPTGTISFDDVVAAGDPAFEIGPTAPDDPALLHFTSGTTGKPKGAVHVHEAVVVHHASSAEVFGLGPDDVFWCTADPGWVTGMSYGVIAPLTHGATLVLDEGELDAARWYKILEREHVNVWYTAPTALRLLRRGDSGALARRDLGALRAVASVGEALDPATLKWARDTFEVAVLDTWWQTETGGIMIANRAGLPVRPGSMGTALPGVTAAVLVADNDGAPRLDDDGHPRVAAVDEPGHLALRAGWPSMFRAYLGAPERYARCFVDGWYLSGDLARMDADGYVWFLGRSDDVIKSAGHLIGPNEVESVLLQHPDVIDAGVIGVPDPIAGEIVKAFVTLRPGVADDEVLQSVLAHARRHLGSAIAPREIVVSHDIPKTKSGKVLRRLLRARELGLPEGDLSTLEPTA